jgi:hypothetical protein
MRLNQINSPNYFQLTVLLAIHFVNLYRRGPECFAALSPPNKLKRNFSKKFTTLPNS